MRVTQTEAFPLPENSAPSSRILVERLVVDGQEQHPVVFTLLLHMDQHAVFDEGVARLLRDALTNAIAFVDSLRKDAAPTPHSNFPSEPE